MKTIDLIIPGMQSAHCQSRVDGVVKTIEGVQMQKLEAGRLSVSLEADEIKEQLVTAIEKAGYKVDAAGSDTAASCSTGCCGN